MHNSTFSAAQYGILSFPLTRGVKADYMAKGVIVKTHTTLRRALNAFLSSNSTWKNTTNSGQNGIIPEKHTFSPSGQLQ